MTICPSFAAFKFNADPTLLDLSLLNHEPPEASGSGTRNDDGTRETPGFYDDADDTPAVEGAAPVDFFDDAGPAFGDNDGGYADDDGAGGFDPGFHAGGGGDGSDDEMAVGAAEAATGGHYGAVQRFDPRMAPEDREVVIGMGGEDGEKKVFGYFDTTMSKNWAGPEHWKMRRTVRRFEKEKEEEEAIANKTTKSAKGRKAKEPFSIKFTVAEDNNAAPATKTIFASSKATLNLPSTASSKRKKGTLANKKEDYLLPDDKHFASQQLLTLFLKPKAAVNMKRRMQRIAPRPAGEVDEHYWAAAAAAQAGVDATGGKAIMPNDCKERVLMFGLSDDDDDDYGPALPFDTQFFHDDGDTPDFDDDLPMGGDEFEGLIGVMGGVEGEGGAATAGKATNEEDDLLKATQGGPAKRVRPIFVNYARKAKRVDVRLLKENIWKELALESSPSTQNEVSLLLTVVFSRATLTFCLSARCNAACQGIHVRHQWSPHCLS
jgi:condensin complex subunit 2